MIGKAVSSLARPAVRNQRALLNGAFPTQRFFSQTSFQAMKLMQTQNKQYSAKELVQQSARINAEFAGRIKSIFAAPKIPGPAPMHAGMPQLVPFAFVNEVCFGFAGIVILVYMFSKYFLPRFVRLFMARMFISKL